MTSQRSSTPAASDVLSPLLLARARAAAPPPLVSAALHQLRRSLHEARAWRAVVVEPGLVRVCPRSPRRRARGEGEPVSLWSLRPLRASCGCLEFAHLRLGICAHVGAALRALAARPRQLERALARAQPPPRGPELRWLPLLPSAEAEPDGLARVRLHLGRDRRRNRHCATLVERWLEPTDEPRVLRPRAGALASPPARSGLVHALARALRVNARRSAAREGARSPRRDWLPQRDSLPLRDWALERLLADELHRLVQVTTQARSDARAARFGALPAAARDFLAAGHAAFERADEAARRCARAAARRLWRTGHVGRSLVVAPESRLGAWERRWPARIPLARPPERAGLVRGCLLLTPGEARRHARWLSTWEPDLVVVECTRRDPAAALDAVLPQASWRLALLHPGADPGARRSLRRWLDPWGTPPRWWSETAGAQRGAA